MRFHNSFKLYVTAYGVALTAVSDIREVAARIVGPADVLENIKESKSFVKNKGEECIKLEADISKNEMDVENVDIGVLGCGEALICLEDVTSFTGARCVDFVEVQEGVDVGDCRFNVCASDDECCEGKFANMAGGDSAIMMTVIIWFVTQMLIAAGITVLAPMVTVNRNDIVNTSDFDCC